MKGCGSSFLTGFAAAFVSAVFVFLVLDSISEQSWKAQAVEHNCAAYDTKTGKWNWKEVKKDE